MDTRLVDVVLEVLHSHFEEFAPDVASLGHVRLLMCIETSQ